MWTKLRDTLTKWLLTLVASPATKLTLLGVFMSFVAGIWYYGDGWWTEVVQWLYSKLPATAQSELAPYVTLLEVVNLWFPVQETLAAMIALWAFQGTIVTIKFVLKFVPTLAS